MHIPLYRTIKILASSYKRQQSLNHLTKGWELNQIRQDLLHGEYNDWIKYYCSLPLKNKVVLDIGAGEGESPCFFIYHGAKTVIAVEPDEIAFKNLSYNAEHHSFIALKEYLSTTLLDKWLPKVDVVKIDVEGYEEQLLDYNITKPIVLEIHGLQLAEKFVAKGYTLFENKYPLGCATASCNRMAHKNLSKRKQQK
jgi:hypothetical protein